MRRTSNLIDYIHAMWLIRMDSLARLDLDSGFGGGFWWYTRTFSRHSNSKQTVFPRSPRLLVLIWCRQGEGVASSRWKKARWSGRNILQPWPITPQYVYLNLKFWPISEDWNNTSWLIVISQRHYKQFHLTSSFFLYWLRSCILYSSSLFPMFYFLFNFISLFIGCNV